MATLTMPSKIKGLDLSEDLDSLGRISLTQTERDDFNEVYVLNTSDADGLYSKGGVHVDIDTETSITVPVTWIPLNICEQAPKEKVLSSPKFRSTLLKGLLTLVDTNDAKKLYESYPEVRHEAVEVMRNMNSSTLEDLRRKEKKKADTSSTVEGHIVKEIMQSPDFNDEQKYTMLLNKRQSFNRADWMHVARNTSHPKILKLANRMLSSE